MWSAAVMYLQHVVLQSADDMGFNSIVHAQGLWNTVFWTECGVTLCLYLVVAYQIGLILQAKAVSPRVRRVFTHFIVILFLTGICGHLTRIIDLPWQLVLALRGVLVVMLFTFIYHQHTLILARHYENTGHDDTKRHSG